jgi:hypothetical protein
MHHFARHIAIDHQPENDLRHLVRGTHASPWQDGGRFWAIMPRSGSAAEVHSRRLYDHTGDVSASAAESMPAEWDRCYRLPVPTPIAVGLCAGHEGVGRACMADALDHAHQRLSRAQRRATDQSRFRQLMGIMAAVSRLPAQSTSATSPSWREG